MAAPTPVPAPDNGSRSVNISTAPRPMAPNAEKDGGGRANAAGCRLEGRRTGACLHGRKIASGPLILDGEHGQRQRYYYQARPGCHQEHHADGEDHRAYHGDRDPAEQPNWVLHLCKHAQHTAGATAGHGFRTGAAGTLNIQWGAVSVSPSPASARPWRPGRRAPAPRRLPAGTPRQAGSARPRAR